MKNNKINLAVFSAFMFLPYMAYAACSAPAGNAGSLNYSTADSKFQYCDGTSWASLLDESSGGASELGDLTDGKYIGNSLYLGVEAGAAVTLTTSLYSTSLGYSTLRNNTSGANNTAVGHAGLYSNTTGSNNTALGYATLYTNTEGGNNTGIGRGSLRRNTTGNSNSALGYQSLFFNTTGSNNIAVGRSAGQYIANGSTENETTTNSIYVGAYTKASADGVTNENVFGYNTTGIGNNSVVLGNDSVVTTALKGSVGIGTTAPGRPLSLYANNTDTVGGLKIEQDSTGDSGILFSLTGVKNWSMGIDNSNSDYFVINNGETIGASSDFVIKNTGAVGVGTNNPTARVHIRNNGSTGITPHVNYDELLIENNSNSTGITFATENDAFQGIMFKDPETSGIGSGFIYYSHADNFMQIGTNDNNALRIDSSGNVGIGTNSPSETLHVNGATNDIVSIFQSTDENALIAFSDNTTGGNAHVRLGAIGNDLAFFTNTTERMRIASGGTVTTTGDIQGQANIIVDNASGADSTLRFNKDGSSSWKIARDDSHGDDLAFYGYAGASDDIHFQPGGATAMTITDGGNVGIGTSTPSAELHVVGDIQYTGGISDVSDRRLKTDIQPLQNALLNILDLQPVSFKMKDNLNKTEFGFVAQDVEEIFPNLVTTAEDVSHTKSMNYVGLIAPLVEAIKEQQMMIEDLKSEVEKLKASQ